MTVGDVVEVVWDDHAFYEDDDEARRGIARQRTVGLFVGEDDRVVMVALGETSWADGSTKFSEVQVIDKRMLVSKRRVRSG